MKWKRQENCTVLCQQIPRIGFRPIHIKGNKIMKKKVKKHLISFVFKKGRIIIHNGSKFGTSIYYSWYSKRGIIFWKPISQYIYTINTNIQKSCRCLYQKEIIEMFGEAFIMMITKLLIKLWHFNYMHFTKQLKWWL